MIRFRVEVSILAAPCDHPDEQVREYETGDEVTDAELRGALLLRISLAVYVTVGTLTSLLSALLGASLVIVSPTIIASTAMALIIIPRIFVKVVILSIIFLCLFPVCIALLPVLAAEAARFPIVSVGLASVRPVLISKVLRVPASARASAGPMG